MGDNMAVYKVYNPETDNYGIYDYFKLEGYNKSLGIILDDKYVFKVGIGDHYVSHVSFEDEYGPYNLWLCADNDYLGISYIRDVGGEITDFQYRCVIGLLKDCQKYINETNKKILFDISERLFTNESMLDEKHDINKIIEDIETKYNMMFGKKK